MTHLRLWLSGAFLFALTALASAQQANPPIYADHSAPINISSATTTQLVPLVAGARIYITSWNVVAGGTGNITLEYGTGASCGTGTTVLTGPYPLTAQAGLAPTAGLGAILFVPTGNALCALTSGAVQMSGSLSYAQF